MTAVLALVVPVQAPLPVADLPFEHKPGRIWLKATLNGQPVDAILDSGAAGIYALESAAARARGVKGEALTVLGLGETPARVWRAEGLSLALGEVAVRVPYILAPVYAQAPRRAIEVSIGFDLLMRYAVEVDYVGARVRLFKPWAYRPPEGYAELRARFTGRNAVVEADLTIPGKGERRVEALLDSGAPFGLEISRKMAVREGLDDLLRDVPVEATPGGISGATKARRVKGVRGRLGGADFGGEARVTLTEGGAGGRDSGYDVLIGDEVLRHYDLVFHYWRGRVYLRPNGR